MIIQLTENRRISSDPHQFTLEKLRKVKDGHKWVAYKYYGSLSAAIQSVPTQLLKESDANGLTEVLRMLRQSEIRLLKMLGE